MIRETEVNYWSKFYESGGAPVEPSPFARYVLKKYFEPGKTLLELGCGNGRDAHYFAENGVDVTAVDQCASEIEKLISTNGTYPNLHYFAGDFTQLDDRETGLDVVYSRFTLHSVTALGQLSTLAWSKRNLVSGGLLCIETRGQENALYQRGEPVPNEEDAFIYEGHYRRFVKFDQFTQSVQESGFKVVEASESAGYAPYRGTDYQFIRVIAKAD